MSHSSCCNVIVTVTAERRDLSQGQVIGALTWCLDHRTGLLIKRKPSLTSSLRVSTHHVVTQHEVSPGAAPPSWPSQPPNPIRNKLALLFISRPRCSAVADENQDETIHLYLSSVLTGVSHPHKTLIKREAVRVKREDARTLCTSCSMFLQQH
jgi:hypothetical protein